MKRTLIAAAVAALTTPVLSAAPAMAFDPDTAGFSADNSSGNERFRVKAQMDCSDTTNGNHKAVKVRDSREDGGT